MLSTVAIAGNKRMFPLVITTVEVESKDTWSWFLYHMHEALVNEPQFSALPSLTIISDQQKELVQVVKSIMPYAKRRYCCLHLLSNMKLRFPDMALRPFFWSVARAPNEFLFQQSMEKIKTISPKQLNGLLAWPKQMWARHTVNPLSKFDHSTNNV